MTLCKSLTFLPIYSNSDPWQRWQFSLYFKCRQKCCKNPNSQWCLLLFFQDTKRAPLHVVYSFLPCEQNNKFLDIWLTLTLNICIIIIHICKESKYCELHNICLQSKVMCICHFLYIWLVLWLKQISNLICYITMPVTIKFRTRRESNPLHASFLL